MKKPAKKKKKPSKKAAINAKKKRVRISLISAGALIAIAAALLLPLILKGMKSYEYEPVRVYVDGDKGPEALRDSLEGALGKEYGNAVYDLWGKIADKSRIRTGSYAVKPGDKAYTLAKRLRNGQQDPVKLTFNNLRLMSDLADRVGAQLHMTPAQFAAAVDSVLSARGVAKEMQPAYFLPDTYEFYWTASPATVVDRLLSYHDKYWNEERTAKAAKLNLSPEQVAVVASIVEEETAMSDERPKVARLYLNRLSKGIKLQADPTVKYAVGDFGLRRILNRHLAVDSPYNTYKYEGLPPGPIRIPSGRTLDAVLDAPDHDYMFMCAKEDFSGYHNFAVDFATHQANARRYQQELNKRGIK